MIIYPAIDLKDGECVRLVQGSADNKTVYSNRPGDVAYSFEMQGASFLHIVDLDGAFTGVQKNLNAIKEIADKISIPFQVGGGLRTMEDVHRIMSLGAQRVIIGTRALKSEGFINELLDTFGPERIILGLDAKNGYVVTHGWVSTSEVTAVDLGLRMRKMGIQTAVFTDVSRDGVLKGPNLQLIEEIAIKTGLAVIASGGVSTLDNIKDLKKLKAVGVTGAIIGKALYDRKLDLREAIREAKS
ncbi:MAG: 1-(5-phosphoribosyl)-5-[(5-phosphoribosylamino)methylideneamino]imidazole-4-carboxamide isomerase [Syntrophomonadaceae bacterium]|jgi:phosphoribosylformimino-5-aminoimidazole carboxamide ribotide isomerase